MNFPSQYPELAYDGNAAIKIMTYIKFRILILCH